MWLAMLMMAPIEGRVVREVAVDGAVRGPALEGAVCSSLPAPEPSDHSLYFSCACRCVV
jgi:hypothetical protein